MEYGYAFALINLSIVFAILGEALFIIAAAIRIAGNPEKISKVKVFFMTIVIAIIIEAIGYIGLLGNVFGTISSIIYFVIAISGFGGMMRVIFTPRMKAKKSENAIKEENKVASVEANENVNNEANEELIKQEVREEIEEEMKELKSEREAEKKLEESVSNDTQVSEVQEEKQEEQNKEEVKEKKDDDKENKD